jgi:predicted  nucleic acid-binding Zn-ribbon protein
MARALVLLLAALCFGHIQAVSLRTEVTASQNPVRKVVQMLQAMSKKIAKEGEAEQELFDKFMCYCKTGMGDLEASIDKAEEKIPQLKAELEASEGTLKETKEGLKQDKADREAAKTAIAEATELRKKENKDWTYTKDNFVANIKAIRSATVAIEKGMAGSFLQTPQAARLQKVANSLKSLLEEDRQQVMSFLSGNPFSHGYAAQSGQIVGILKQMGDSMSTTLAEEMAIEEKALHSFEELVKAKTSEVDALTEAIEVKTAKIGELGVFMTNGQDDIDDMSEGLEEDKKFLKELKKGCDTKAAEWEERKKTRAAELLALADTIKILNNDDALELFKKTLPAPGAALLQVQVSAKDMRRRAVAVLKEARGKAPHHNRAKLDMILLSLNGKSKGDFTKVIKLIDEMMVMLAEEQKQDEEKKAYCLKEFDEADDKKKALEHNMEVTANEIQKAKAAIEELTEEIAALIAGIKELDKEVAEATEQRKAENAEYKDVMAADSAAEELLKIAKNRLNKFYNPKLYKESLNPDYQNPADLSDQDRIVVEMGNPDDIVTTTQPGGIGNTGVTVFAQVSMRARSSDQVAPPPPPETWDAYTKKGEESTGVIQMIDLLIKDLALEMTEVETNEKEAQKDYEALMADSADKRATDSKTLADKEQVKADTEVALEKFKAAQLATFKELQTTEQYISSLHADCDWLLQFFDVRVEARASEVESLKQCKAVLSGADYSLLETGTHHHFLSRQ